MPHGQMILICGFNYNIARVVENDECVTLINIIFHAYINAFICCGGGKVLIGQRDIKNTCW